MNHYTLTRVGRRGSTYNITSGDRRIGQVSRNEDGTWQAARLELGVHIFVGDYRTRRQAADIVAL